MTAPATVTTASDYDADAAIVQQFRDARISRGLSQAAAARRMDIAQPTLSDIESRKKRLTPRMRQAMQAEISIAAEDGVLPWFGPWLAAERQATSLRAWEGPVVPGLAQVDGYARHLLETASPGIPAAELDRQVAARVGRQDIWQRENPPPPRLSAIISESALRQLVATPAVMAAQMRRLLEIARLPGVRVHVLPFTACDSAAVNSPFVVASFAPGPRADVAYLDDALAGRTTDKREAVAKLSLRYDGLALDALRRTESLELIEGAAEEWTRKT
jgi:transcriptional regulator with XRE-family HTH domain